MEYLQAFKCQAQARRDARKEAHRQSCDLIRSRDARDWFILVHGKSAVKSLPRYELDRDEQSTIMIHYDPKEGSRSCLGLGTKSCRSLTSFAQITRLKVMSLHHDARREELGRA